MPTKASDRQADQQRGLERAPADADQRLEHDHQHGRLDAEQRAVDQREAAPERVEQAEPQHHQRARQHEQDAGDQPAAHAMQQPADVGRELLRLRSRQQHAEVERVQEARLVDPFLLVDHDAMHHRDLAGRAAEVDAADLEPCLEELAESLARSMRMSAVVMAMPPYDRHHRTPRINGTPDTSSRISMTRRNEASSSRP